MLPYVRVLTYTLILLLPVLANLVEHAGSIIFCVLALFGLGAWMARKTLPVFSRPEKILMATFAGYFLFCFAAYLLNGLFNPRADLDWNLDHEIRFLGFIPIYYLLARWSGIKEGVLRYGVVMGALGSMAYALWLAWTVQPGRVAGPYNPIAFGNLALVYGFMALSGIRYFYQRHPLQVGLPVMAAIGGLLTAFLSGTLSAVLAAPLLSLLFLVQLGGFSRPWTYRCLMILVLGLAFVCYYQFSSAPIQNRLHSELNEARLFFDGGEDKLQGEQAYRLRVWKAAWRVFQANPLLGVGKEQYREEIGREARIDAPHLHNMFLDHLVNYGIFGVLLFSIYAVPMGLLLRVTARSRSPGGRDMAYTGLTLVVGLTLFSLTECIFFRNVFISTYIILLAAIFVLVNDYETESRPIEDPSNGQ